MVDSVTKKTSIGDIEMELLSASHGDVSLSDSQADGKVDRLAHYLLRAVNKAVRRYRMIADGTRILVAVSGGKDSLTLLDLLHRRRQMAREHYTLVAAHIRSDAHCGRAAPVTWLQAWCETRGIPLYMQDLALADELATANANKCFRCAWNRRKALFQLADHLGCATLAFGHHADDIAETTLMNLFYSGRLARMEPKVSFFGGRLLVIRPLALVEERDIVPYARASGFPIQGEPCPEGRNSRRATIKRLLRELEQEHPQVKRSIFSAVERQQATMRRLLRCNAETDSEEDDGAEAGIS